MKKLLCVLLSLALLTGTGLAGVEIPPPTPLPEGAPEWFMLWEEVVELRTDPPSYLCRQENKYYWSLVDASGRVLFDHALDMLSSFEDGVALIRRGTGYGYLLEDGMLLAEPELDYAGMFYEGLACVEKDEKKGFMNRSGEMVVDFTYDFANDFIDGYAAVGLRGEMKEDVGFSDFAYEQFWGVVDREGNLLIPLEYDSITYNSSDKVFTAEKENRERLFVITDGKAQEIMQVASDIVLTDYLPHTGAKLAALDEPANIKWNASAPLPALDGATALFPVYSAFAQETYLDAALYSEDLSADPLITCTKTNRAYERLIDGSADVIFCAQPSDAQVEIAAAAGVEFELTPFGKEAFVFIVNRDNPLDGLTAEQIRKVYSGEITRWDELGAAGIGEIIPYQRPKNSGSQTALEKFMGDVPLMPAYGEIVEDFMGDIIERVEYRNLPNALGYTFRFFCTDMIGSDVKLLSIDGVAPTVENIRSSAYPVTSTLYAVTRKGETNPNVQILLDWVASPQGQSLVEKTGYVGWNG